MNLEHVDKLRETVRQVIEKYRMLRFRNFQLEQENKALKNQLQQAENSSVGVDQAKWQRLLAENKKLKSEKEEVKQRLNKLIAELERLTN